MAETGRTFKVGSRKSQVCLIFSSLDLSGLGP